MNNLFDILTGNIDESKQYYTESMFNDEIGAFIITVLMKEGIVSNEKFEEYKKEYMSERNKMIIESLKWK